MGSISNLYSICYLWCDSTKQLEQVTQTVTSFIAVHFSWYYLLLVLLILIVSVYLLFSRYASITLGKGEDPEFSLPSWFAMLFSAGMGIGLVFWTTAEPISHAFTLTPIHKAGTQSAINDAMQFLSSIGVYMPGQFTAL